MADKSIVSNSKLTAIANAIRSKTGTTASLTLDAMANEINSIETGTSSVNVMKALLDGRKSANYLFNKYSGTSVDDLISYSDTENVTNMGFMFYNCENLTTIPLLDTSKVTNTECMFDGCRSLTSIPLLDTSKTRNMYNMFSSCRSLTTIPQLDTSEVTSMQYMFISCRKITTIPLLNTSKVTSMYGMFRECGKLMSIPAFDVRNVTSMSEMLKYCTSLKRIEMYGMKVNFDISSSTQFETEDLVIILNNLATVTVTRTLTMGATNLAKLSDEQKLIATNKGWTLA